MGSTRITKSSKGVQEWHTVGTTEADYTTIQAAVDDGKSKLKLITDITTSADVTLPADYCLTIDLNTKIATFAPDVRILNGYSVEVIDNTGYRKGEVNFSTTNTTGFQGITATYSIARGIVVRNITTTSGFSFTTNPTQFFKQHKDCNINFSNTSLNRIEYAHNCILIGGGTSCSELFAQNTNYEVQIKNCVLQNDFRSSSFLGKASFSNVKGSFTLLMFLRIYGNNDNIQLTNCNVIIEDPSTNINNITCKNIDIISSNCILNSVNVEGNFNLYSGSKQKISNIKVNNDLYLGSFFGAEVSNSLFSNIEVLGMIYVIDSSITLSNVMANLFLIEGDNCNLSNAYITTNLNIYSQADKTSIINTRVGGTATDNGTNTLIWEIFTI